MLGGKNFAGTIQRQADRIFDDRGNRMTPSCRDIRINQPSANLDIQPSEIVHRNPVARIDDHGGLFGLNNRGATHPLASEKYSAGKNFCQGICIRHG